MRIEHVALWTRDLEGRAASWADRFGATLSPSCVSRDRPWLRLIQGRASR